MPESSIVFDSSIDGYAMVNIQIKKDLLQGEASRKVKFDTPEFFEEAHVLTKVSIVPRAGSQEDQDKTKPKYKQMAYGLHSEVNDSLSYLAEDANSFFCEGKSKLKPTDSQNGASSVKVGTDCSGIGIPIIAFRLWAFALGTCSIVTATKRSRRPSEQITNLKYFMITSMGEM